VGRGSVYHLLTFIGHEHGMAYHVFIATCHSNTAIHIGHTSDLSAECRLLRLGQSNDFSARYRIVKLVWFVHQPDLVHARQYAARLKRWRRAWKEDLIAKSNPSWRDLAPDLREALAGLNAENPNDHHYQERHNRHP